MTEPLWETISLNQVKFTTGSFYAPGLRLRTCPVEKHLHKCTERMFTEAPPGTEGLRTPSTACSHRKSQMVEYSKAIRKNPRTQINLPDMLLNKNSKFPNKSAVFKRHLFKNTYRKPSRTYSTETHTHVSRQSGGKNTHGNRGSLQGGAGKEWFSKEIL